MSVRSNSALVSLILNLFLFHIFCAAGAHGIEPEKPIFSRNYPGQKPPRVAIALGGGGIRGAAHLGVLKVLQEEGVPIDYVVGSSIGAIIGGLYAADVPLEKIKTVLCEGSLPRSYPPKFLWLHVICMPFRDLLGIRRPYAGIESGKALKATLEVLLPNPEIEVSDLRIPFACTAVSLLTGQKQLLCKGKLSEIMRASASIPILMRPIEIDGDLFVDGGIRNNLPTHEARNSGARIVISVQTDAEMTPIVAKRFRSYRNVLERVTDAALEELDKEKGEAADIVIRPKLVNFPLLSRDKKYLNEAIQQGEISARQQMVRIKEILKEHAIALEGKMNDVPVSTAP